MLHGQPVLQHVVEHVLRSQWLDLVVVASPAPFSGEVGCPVLVYEGEEGDVLGRYRWAADHTQADLVVRVTGDCPCVRPHDINRVIVAARSTGADYTTNSLLRLDSEGYGDGFEVEAFTRAALVRIDAHATWSDREHVTRAFKRESWRYNIMGVPLEAPLGKWSVDTPQDLARLEALTDARCQPIS